MVIAGDFIPSGVTLLHCKHVRELSVALPLLSWGQRSNKAGLSRWFFADDALVSSFQVLVQLSAFSSAQPVPLRTSTAPCFALLPVFMLPSWLQGSRIWEHTKSLTQRWQKGPGDAAVVSLLMAFKVSQVGHLQLPEATAQPRRQNAIPQPVIPLKFCDE